MAEQVKIELVVVDKTSGALKKTKNQVVQLNSSLIGTGRLAKLAGTAIAAIGAARIARAILNTAAQFQDLRIALASVTGSIKQGREAFEFILDFARTSIFEVSDLTTTFIKLRGAGIEPTRKLLTTFQDVAAVSADRLGTLQAITDLFARTTAGGLGLEELNRLGDRGIPVFKMLEDTLGLSRLEISKVGQTAEGATLILDALQFSINNAFGGSSALLTTNYSQAVSNLNDAFSSLADTIGQGFLPQLTKSIKKISEGTGDFNELGEEIGLKVGAALALIADGFVVVAKNFELILKLALGIFFVKLGAAAVRAAGAIFLMGAAIVNGFLAPGKGAFNLLKKLIPSLGKLAATVGGAFVAFEFATKILDEFEKKAKEIEQSIKDENKALEENEKKIKSLKLSIEEADGVVAKFRKRLTGIGKALIIDASIKGFKKLDQEIQLSTGSVKIATDAFMTFTKGIGDAFADAIFDAKNLTEALSNLARTVVKQVVASIITLAIQIMILDKLRPVFEKMAEGIRKKKNEQDKLNNSLKTEIGLRAVLALFGGGGGGGIPFLAEGGSLQRGQPAIVGEEGPELFVPNQSGSVIPNDRIRQSTSTGDMMGEAVTVNFNINTVDAAGFDELLVDRRNTIVGIINSALTKRGKVGVTS